MRLFVRFKDIDLLAGLIKIVEAQENGENKLYTITNDLANGVGLRQGRVSGAFKADPQDGLMCSSSDVI